MRNAAVWTVVVCAAAGWAYGQDNGAAQAAPKPPDHYYKLNLTVEQLNDAGRVQNSRVYVMTIASGNDLKPGQMGSIPEQQIRTGARVPVATGTGGGSTQWQYVDVGVDFDVRHVSETGGELAFELVADVSSIAPTPSTLVNAPVIRQNKWDSTVVIAVGKPTLVFSADDLDDKGRMQVEVTATPVE